VYHSAKTAGSGATLLFCTGFKEPSVSNAIAYTSRNTIENLDGAVRLTTRSIHQDWKLKKGNLAPTRSSAQTVVETTLPTPINAHFGATGSIGSSTRENMLRSMRIDLNHFILKRTTLLINDCGKSQDLFAKCSQEPSLSQHSSRNLNPFQHYLNSRTSLVRNP